MVTGRVWDGSPLSHSRPKIYGYFPPRPKLGLGRGMHSYPRFEVIIKISSLTHFDPGMCMHFVLPKKGGKQWVTDLLKWEKEISKKTTPYYHHITDLLYIWTLQIFWLSYNYNDPNKKEIIPNITNKSLIFCPETNKETP